MPFLAKEKISFFLNEYFKEFHQFNFGIKVGTFISKLLAWNTLYYFYLKKSCWDQLHSDFTVSPFHHVALRFGERQLSDSHS